MNQLERLQAALAGKETDRPPCICPGGMMNMITTALLEKEGLDFRTAHTDGAAMARVAALAYENGCFENLGVPFCMTVEAEQMGAKTDLGDNTKEPRVTEYAIRKLSQLPELSAMDLQQGRAKAVLDAISILKRDYPAVPVIGNLTGPVSTAASLIDPNRFYIGFRKDPEGVHALMDFVTDQLIAFGRAMARAGADVIMIADPSGTGEIMGPRFFEEYTVFYLNKLLDGLKKEGCGTIIHICGQMAPVLEQTGQIRCDAYSFDAIVPVLQMKSALAGKVLMGNVSTYAIEGESPEKVISLSENAIRQGFRIISPACGLGMGSPLANVQAVLKGVQEAAWQK